MAMSYDKIVAEFDEYIEKRGGKYSDYYVGITDDAERRLFDEHKVDRDHGSWVYAPAISDDVARKVEKHYLDLGCEGGSGGGDEDSRIVYCYKMTSTTEP